MSMMPGPNQALKQADQSAMSRMDQNFDGKANPADVHYRPSEDQEVRCGECRFFDAPSSCMKVAGTIDQNAVCDLFKSEKENENDAEDRAEMGSGAGASALGGGMTM